jgi:hypothetical protein
LERLTYNGRYWYIMAIWSILRPFGIFCGNLVCLMVIWYIYPCLGMLRQKKSSNPATKFGQISLKKRQIKVWQIGIYYNIGLKGTSKPSKATITYIWFLPICKLRPRLIP